MKLAPIILLPIVLLSGFSDLKGQSPDSAFISLNDFQEMVSHNKKRAQTWWYSWIAGYTTLTAVQGTVAISAEEKSLRQDMALGAATTFIGALGTLLTPVVPGKSFKEEHGPLGNDSTDVWNYNEILLREIARRERAGRSWKVHAAAGMVDLGSGLITWLGYKRSFRDGLINFALNTVIAEAQIWSQPTRAVRDYRRLHGTAKNNLLTAPEKPGSRIFIGSYPGGLTIRAVF